MGDEIEMTHFGTLAPPIRPYGLSFAWSAELESSGLQLPYNWQPVTNLVNAISGTNTVSLPASTNAQFFRLNYP